MNAKKVLIIEDEKPLAKALQLKLQKVGHSTYVARNGEEGLEAIAQQEFDVILLDLIMPGMDGFQVLERLKDLPKKPVVFVLSNLGQAEDEQRAKQLGAYKYLIKSDTSLASIVEEINNIP